MTKSKLIPERLRENNPFASQNSPLPWDNTIPDLQQLNRETSEEIEHLIRHKRRSPYEPLAGLIIGETGSGKTHMLTRILRKLRENKNPSIFVLVRTFINHESVRQHLLSEVFISLKRIYTKGRSQFDVVAEEVMNVYKERRLIDGFDDLSKLDTRVYLAKDMPGLDRDFLKGFLSYTRTNDEAVKLNILECFEHGLDNDESQRLGLPVGDTDSMSSLKLEDNARKILISLGIILGYAKIPMIICFDQLENMKEKKLIDAWGDLLSLLVNEIPGVLPLCFMRPETWNNLILPVLDASVIRRLEGNRIIMKAACTPKYASQLIHDRITSVFGKEESEEIYQWLLHKTESNLKRTMHPGEIIRQVNRIITGSDTENLNDEQEIFGTIKAAYEEEYEKVKSEPQDWPPNADNLTLTLKLWLESHEEFEIINGDRKYIRLMGNYGQKKFAFIVCARRHSSVARAAFRRGNDFFSVCPLGECFYITEDKTNKSTWNKVKELRDTFESSGGHVIMLNKDTRINWYALTALINRTDNGDVNLYLTSGSRSASRDEIMKFIRTIELIPGMFSGKTEHEDTSHEVNREVPNETQKPEETNKPAIEADMLSMNLNSIIKSSPMNLISISRAIEALLRREIIISREELILFLKNNTWTFRTYASANDTLIALNDKN